MIKDVSKTIKNEAKNKKEDFQACYKVHYGLVYLEIY